MACGLQMPPTCLKKCLCKRESRYANCEELLEDINGLLSFLHPNASD